jgi:hypothetical protein
MGIGHLISSVCVNEVDSSRGFSSGERLARKVIGLVLPISTTMEQPRTEHRQEARERPLGRHPAPRSHLFQPIHRQPKIR